MGKEGVEGRKGNVFSPFPYGNMTDPNHGIRVAYLHLTTVTDFGSVTCCKITWANFPAGVSTDDNAEGDILSRDDSSQPSTESAPRQSTA